MARKLRVEYDGALYHVINRGNFRADVFASKGTREAFERCLLETCEKSQWRLHAYVIMRNHYHLAVETPRGNLVDGMQWLQSTFANRFNRVHDVHGHVFQGRYHAFLVESLRELGAVGHYIHLNPVRAGVVRLDELEGYHIGSYGYLRRPKARPAWLSFDAVLSAAGGLADRKAGWNSYAAYLKWLAENEPAQKGLAFDQMCRGWAIGSEVFKQDVRRKFEEKLLGEGTEATTRTEARVQAWNKELDRALARLGKSPKEVAGDAKAAPWKVAIAAHLKTVTTSSNPWIAEALHMGAHAAISRYVTEFRSGQRPAATPYFNRISKG